VPKTKEEIDAMRAAQAKRLEEVKQNQAAREAMQAKAKPASVNPLAPKKPE
jgi:hypothetical protein